LVGWVVILVEWWPMIIVILVLLWFCREERREGDEKVRTKNKKNKIKKQYLNKIDRKI
jgi:hypothetical protein